jgi:hypothetical protein
MELVMMNGFSELMQLHPASRFGGSEHRPRDVGAGEQPEGRDPRTNAEREAVRRKPARTVRRLATAAAMLVAFLGVLTTMS